MDDAVTFDDGNRPVDPALHALGVLAMALGCIEVEIAYQNDPDRDPEQYRRFGPRWWASTRHLGDRVTVEGYRSAGLAADGLSRALLRRIACPECGRPILPGAGLAVASRADECRWARVHNLWTGCVDIFREETSNP